MNRFSPDGTNGIEKEMRELGSRERMREVAKEIDSPENAWTVPAEEAAVEVSEAERERILDSVLLSRKPPRLRLYPPILKKKLVILRLLADQFEYGRVYRQTEVNEILGAIWQDPATLRRDLVDMGWLARERDGSIYWRN